MNKVLFGLLLVGTFLSVTTHMTVMATDEFINQGAITRQKRENLIALFDKLKAGTITNEEKDRMLKILCQLVLNDMGDSE